MSDEGRVLTVQDFTVLWTFFLIGLPTLLVGARLTASPAAGGLGFSFSQLVFAALIGALAGGFLLGGAAWAGAYNAVPTVVMLRAALGVLGGYLLVVLNLVFLVTWAAFEMAAGADTLDQALEGLFGFRLGAGSVALLALVAGLMLWAGPKLVAVWWVRRFAVWAALALFVFLLWRLLSGVDLGVLLSEPRAPGFWAGADLVLALSVLWFPLIADTSRLVSDEGSAASGAGLGFGVAVVLLVLLGGLVGLGPGSGTDASEVVGALLASLAGLTALALVGWVLLAQADQPFAYLYSTGVSAQGVLPWIPAWLLGMVGLVVAAVLAALNRVGVLLPYVELLVSIYVPIFGLFLADFFLVRRKRYNLDALYRRDGPYGGVNLMALLPFLLGFIVFQWVSPVGPAPWVELVRNTIPGGVPLGEQLEGLPPTVLSLLVSFGIYAVVGRWRVQEEVYVSPIRGRL